LKENNKPICYVYFVSDKEISFVLVAELSKSISFDDTVWCKIDWNIYWLFLNILYVIRDVRGEVDELCEGI